MVSKVPGMGRRNGIYGGSVSKTRGLWPVSNVDEDGIASRGKQRRHHGREIMNHGESEW